MQLQFEYGCKMLYEFKLICRDWQSAREGEERKGTAAEKGTENTQGGRQGKGMRKRERAKRDRTVQQQLCCPSGVHDMLLPASAKLGTIFRCYFCFFSSFFYVYKLMMCWGKTLWMLSRCLSICLSACVSIVRIVILITLIARPKGQSWRRR